MNEPSFNLPEAIRTDFSSGGDTMFIAFASGHRNKVPPFQWIEIMAGIPAKKIFVRDVHKLWYQKGLPGIANSPKGASEYLQGLVFAQNCRKVVILGSSQGGYAALLYGCLMEVDIVHAVNPQTFLPTKLTQIFSRSVIRPRKNLLKPIRKYVKLIANPTIDKRYFDLKPLLEKLGSETTCNIYYSDDDLKDRSHAERLRGLTTIQLHKKSFTGHYLAPAMRESGELKKILLQSV